MSGTTRGCIGGEFYDLIGARTRYPDEVYLVPDVRTRIGAHEGISAVMVFDTKGRVLQKFKLLLSESSSDKCIARTSHSTRKVGTFDFLSARESKPDNPFVTR